VSVDIATVAVNLTRRFSVDGVWRRLQFALLPAHCLLCGADSERERDLCGACADDLSRNIVCCPRCALPLPAPAPLCGECLQREPPYACATIPFVYAAPLDQLMTRFKFGRSLAAGRVLAELWIDALRATAQATLPQALLPVPLHTVRLRERGFNQALELARPLARALGIPLRDDILQRTRATAAQSELDAVERRRNLRGAFSVAKTVIPTHVALVDDVMTTGTTLREAAKTLLHAGALRVDVWALARAPKPRSG